MNLYFPLRYLLKSSIPKNRLLFARDYIRCTLCSPPNPGCWFWRRKLFPNSSTGFFRSSKSQLFLCRNPSASHVHHACIANQPQRALPGPHSWFFPFPKGFFPPPSLSETYSSNRKKDCPNGRLKNSFLYLLIFTVAVVSCIYNTLESGKNKNSWHVLKLTCYSISFKPRLLYCSFPALWWWWWGH